MTDKGELIRHVLQNENLSAHDCVMIGDREHDIIGAGKSNVPGIGVLYGYGSPEELKRAGAAAICATPAELPGTIASILKAE